MDPILLIDEPDVCAHGMCGGHGVRVLEAGDAEEALQMAREHGEAIDLLLTDV